MELINVDVAYAATRYLPIANRGVASVVLESVVHIGFRPGRAFDSDSIHTATNSEGQAS